MNQVNEPQSANSHPNRRLRDIRWALIETRDRLTTEIRNDVTYPPIVRLLLIPIFLILRSGFTVTINLLSLPIYLTRDSAVRFMTYSRRRGDTYIDSYTNFKNSARWTLGIVIVTVLAVATAVPLATFLRNNTVTITHQKQIFKIGILKRSAALDPLIDSFKRDLAERGYRAGERVIYDEQISSGSTAEMEEVAGKFVDQKKDLIFAVGDVAAMAVREATKKINIPTVYYSNFDPVEDGLIKSYSRSENNFVGVSDGALVKQQGELLKRIAPDARTIGVMSVPTDGTNQRFIRALKSAAPPVNLLVQTVTITTIEDIPQALDEMMTAGISVVYLAPSAMTAPHLEFIAQEALARKMILIGNSATNAEAGALFALMADLDSVGRQLAVQAEQIFRGIFPSQISSQFPAASLLALNLKTAATLNLTIPADIIERAGVKY